MELRQYQQDISTAACELLKQHKIAYLNMQVRTGKTITAFETVKKYGAKIVIFVTKKKAISSIEKDYLTSYVNDFQLYIVNFESLHKIVDLRPQLFIIDEAHSLGQYPIPSLRTIQLKSLCSKLPVILLSGTPSPESYSQIYHQFWISTYSPFEEKSFYLWVKNYVKVAEKYVFNRKINDYSNANQQKIEEKTNHLFIPYTQEEAGFTELVQETVHHVKMSDKIYKIANRLRIDKVVTGKDGQVIEADTEVKLLNKLHQLYSGTVLFDSGTEINDGLILDDTKVKWVLDKFKGRKIAIYYKFRAEAIMIEVACKLHGLSVTNDANHFNTSDNSVIYISQFVSGREGVNLSSADALICINIDFSAITYFQVRARLQSKDRTRAAEVHWVFAEGGIEDRIYKAVQNKENYTLSYFRKDEKKMDTK
jgi:hypothetical protein